MKKSIGIKILSAVACVAVWGCMQVDKGTASQPEKIMPSPLGKGAAYCSAYLNWAQSWATNLTSCATNTQNSTSCYSQLLSSWGPIFNCLDISAPSATNASAWASLSSAFATKLSTQAGVTSFTNCLCGDIGGGEGEEGEHGESSIPSNISAQYFEIYASLVHYYSATASQMTVGQFSASSSAAGSEFSSSSSTTAGSTFSSSSSSTAGAVFQAK